jgi:hypothetical protein
MHRSAIIDVVIDERSQFQQMDETRIVARATARWIPNRMTQRVFRNTILASEPFELDPSLN